MYLPEPLVEWDKHLLLFINQHNSSWLDSFYWTLSGSLFPIVFGVVLLFLLVKDNGVKTVWYLIFLGLTILLADNISSAIIKPVVARLRPSHDPSIMNLLHIVHDYRGGMYGFVSSHAANTFGVALFLSLLLRNHLLSFSFFIWAALTSYSRMYLGVHYPVDIIGGMVVGLLSGACCFLLMEMLAPKILKSQNLDTPPYLPVRERSYFLIVYGVTFLIIAIKSFF
ncbi:phosphatase PAP2 family protein [Paludibacter jiangxiensis]|uniref:Undecaprenyl-diphosphatase n=1 Tax=Paludibacter jiangxiensis TaxID=681398 RepID=A0A171A717_9BACT|nr:phosphatase PAP2 family protein [Paludibacter jiangxiensis]GAT63350.1 undecaprenyl-diphosphatase [Paludibacter jiangxiensis]